MKIVPWQMQKKSLADHKKKKGNTHALRTRPRGCGTVPGPAQGARAASAQPAPPGPRCFLGAGSAKPAGDGE